jgi:hypothetical protein
MLHKEEKTSSGHWSFHGAPRHSPCNLPVPKLSTCCKVGTVPGTHHLKEYHPLVSSGPHKIATHYLHHSNATTTKHKGRMYQIMKIQHHQMGSLIMEDLISGVCSSCWYQWVICWGSMGHIMLPAYGRVWWCSFLTVYKGTQEVLMVPLRSYVPYNGPMHGQSSESRYST